LKSVQLAARPDRPEKLGGRVSLMTLCSETGEKMKKGIPTFLAFAPIWGAVISAPVACYISGPTFSSNVNQGAMVVRFLWIVIFPFLSIVPIVMAKQLSEQEYSKKMERLGAILWLPGAFLNYYLLTKIH
jgi:hypothetical protein